MTPIQPFRDLEPAIERALEDSIRRHGILVPLVFDQHGRLLDGHHRKRIADEFGVTYDRSVRFVESDEEAHQLAVELNLARRHLNPAERRRVAADLRKRGHSLRAIAAVTGVSKSQTAHDVKQVSTTGHLVIGLDAKRYPARRPQIFVASDAEQRRAQHALTTLGPDAPNRTLRLVDAEHRMRKRQVALRARASGKAKIGNAELYVGDFRGLLGSLRAGSVDLLLTDVPYSRKHYPDFIDHGLDDLAEHAARVLRKNGTLAVMMGNAWLPRAIAAFEAHLRYRWTVAFLTTGGSRPTAYQARAHAGWKPVVVFNRNDGVIRDGCWIEDVVLSAVSEKAEHEHQQNLDAFAELVEMLSSPGNLVVDPFMGAATTGLAAIRLGRRFVGGDIDARAVAIARDRLQNDAH